MSKAIYFAGVSRVAGELKFRTATEPGRFQQLIKLGDTDVEMVNLNAETKQQAAEELLSRNFANGRADIQALLESVAGKTSAPRKAGTVRVRARKIKISKAAAEADDIKLTPKQAAKIREEFNARLKDAYEAN
ncbi:hypothetical protein UFOVP328_418 [uncultured Caudovirales phage]|uniref:Uncharacterized protein n=1 Tax=uncultured Caudovirales phage TaxID=2100421 RepID=A0A6J5LUV4_9CAUD|nr:hypothetical protein UFOVP328_418 [uncultured Caudovirales phage]